MSAPTCLFCKIVAGELRSEVVAETEHSFAFRDIEPIAPVHVLVVPRRHVQNLGELVEYADELVDLIDLAATVADDEGLDRGWRLLSNTGSEAGQQVYHAHVHVIGGRAMTWPPG
ncbi:MAG: HIT domain-containing protein [Dermatophilaceae bacterium]